MNNELFDKKVAQALEQIPEEFKEKMENVQILVEDFADEETLASLGVRSKWELLGLYSGVPISRQSFFSVSSLPETIFLYRRPILRAAGSLQKLTETIRDVIIHEIGHHFGFDDEELYEMTGHEE